MLHITANLICSRSAQETKQAGLAGCIVRNASTESFITLALIFLLYLPYLESKMEINLGSNRNETG